MYEINPRFQDRDGSIDFDAAAKAARKARAETMGQGFRYLSQAMQRVGWATLGACSSFIEYLTSARSIRKSSV